MAERGRALNYGGIGAIHLMGQRLGLAKEIDGRLQLLKRHLPYHESDHVLNLAYNALLDGQRDCWDEAGPDRSRGQSSRRRRGKGGSSPRAALSQRFNRR
jgi:hypothetical protein